MHSYISSLWDYRIFAVQRVFIFCSIFSIQHGIISVYCFKTQDFWLSKLLMRLDSICSDMLSKYEILRQEEKNDNGYFVVQDLTTFSTFSCAFRWPLPFAIWTCWYYELSNGILIGPRWYFDSTRSSRFCLSWRWQWASIEHILFLFLKF